MVHRYDAVEVFDVGYYYLCSSDVVAQMSCRLLRTLHSTRYYNIATFTLTRQTEVQDYSTWVYGVLLVHSTYILYYIPMIRYSCSVLRYALVTHIVQVTAHAVVTLYALHLQVTARRDITYEMCGVP